MEYILKLKPKFNCLYGIGNIKRKIEKDSFETLKLNIKEHENFVLSVEPMAKKESLLLAYNIYIKNENYKLIIESPNIDVLNYKNVYILEINSLEAVKDMKVLLSETSYSVFNTYCSNITTKTGTTKLPILYNNACIEKLNNFDIVTFDGEKKYIAVLQKGEIIFADFYSELSKKNNEIEVLTDLDDLAKHSIITKINTQGIEKTTVYKYNNPKISYSEKIIPLAFLQAIKAKNIKLCKYYLSGNLKDVASLETLSSFFGDFKKFELDNDNIVLFYKENEKYNHKTFAFKIKESKIYHIDIV